MKIAVEHHEPLRKKSKEKRGCYSSNFDFF